MNFRQSKKLKYNDEIQIKSTKEIVKVVTCEIDTTFNPPINIIHASNNETYTHDEIS